MPAADPTISVVMVMANALYRQGLLMLLESGGDTTVIAQAYSCELAVDTVSQTAPDVVIVEIDQSHVEGELDDIVACVAASPASGIIALGDSLDMDPILELFDAGVRGYVLKENQAETLIDAIRAVAQGRFVLDTHVIGGFLEAVREMRSKLESCCPGNKQSVLTERQHELLAMVAEGLTNRQIAAELNISESTVKNHLHQVFSKLGVTSRSQAISVGVRLGIVRP